MPGPGRTALRQRACLFLRQGTDGFGRPTVNGVPEELACRWESKRRTTRGPEGDELVLDATAWLTRFVEPGSILRKGGLDELPPGTDFSDSDEQLYEVISCDAVPDLKARTTAWVANLQRWRQGLPQQT